MNRASAPGYDLFKLIVTIALVIILILMLLRGCSVLPAVPVTAGDGTEPVSTQSSGPSVQTESLPASDTAEPATPSATATTAPTVTASAESATPTTAPETATPESFATAQTATSAATEATPSGETSACNTSSPSRLAVGQQARVLQRLNMRSDASITASILKVNPTGTQVEVIGGPVCTPVGESAYLWWQIRLADGSEGWSAETPLNDKGYFLEPVSP